MSDVIERARANLRRWRDEPDGVVQFVREVLKAEPDPWQIDALFAYQTGLPRTCLKACKNPGKTTTLAWICWHFLTCFEHPNIAATSITGDNLRDGLWKEMAKWQLRSPMLAQEFQWTAERIFYKKYPATWWMSARKWSKSADANVQANTLAGLHQDAMLFVLDETGDMPRAVMAAADAALGSGVVTRLVQAGNPTKLEGPLYDACTSERALWNIVDITGDPDDPKRAPRVKIEWARDQIKKYGKDSPWVLVNVFGVFPPASLNSLLGIDQVEAAMKRHLQPDVYNWQQKRLGIDVARFGDDLTVIAPRQGKAWFKPVAMAHVRDSAVSVDIANRVMLAKQRWASEVEMFDDTVGWAHGARDVMVAAGHSSFAFNFAGKSPDPRYANMRAFGWMLMAEDVKNGASLPNVPELVAELTTPTYMYHNGKFQIEDKDSIKERLGRSPNYADAYALTYMLPDMPSQMSSMMQAMGHGRHASTEFDPYRDDEQAARDRAMTDFDPFDPRRDTL